LGVPDGWRIAGFDSGDTQPSRIAAVYGQRPRGGWDGCETITVFGFTGIPNLDDVRRNADCTLRDLDADAITTQRLVVPPGQELWRDAAAGTSAPPVNEYGPITVPTLLARTSRAKVA
jgi:hypothetical protein